jgi:hypothetical protein
MRRIVNSLLVMATMVACGVPSPSAAEPQPEAGPKHQGLSLRVKAPQAAARGDDLVVDLFLRVDTRDLPSGTTIDLRSPDHFARLVLTPEAGGEPVTIRPRDPTFGMPDPPPPEGEPRTRAALDGMQLGAVPFPLATVWDVVEGGRWQGVVELALEGEPRGRPIEGEWKGTLRSQPFPVAIESPPQRWLELRVPPALLGADDGPRAIMRLPIRNGFAVGMDYGKDHNTQLGTGAPKAGVFDDALLEISQPEGPQTFVIFETSYHPEHFWHPAPGTHHYRVLWRRSAAYR